MANTNMSSGIADKKQAGAVLSSRLKTLATRPSQKREGGGGFWGFITNKTDPILERGQARQFIRKGEQYEGISDKNSRRASEAVDSIMRALVSW